MNDNTIYVSDLLFQSRIVLAEIIYRMPDYPCLLQSFIWQDEDLPPVYPNLKNFLQFWNAELEGKIYMVKLDTKKMFGQSDIIHAKFDGMI